MPRTESYSGHIELVVWSIPAMVVILLGGVAWTGSHLLDPARADQGRCQTDSHRSRGARLEMAVHLPGPDRRGQSSLSYRPAHRSSSRLTSATVMNAFFVPQLGSQIYTMPGMTTRLNLLAEHAGDYPGLLRKFQRRRLFGHALRGAQPCRPAEFPDAGSRRARNGGSVLDAAAYAKLARPGGNAPRRRPIAASIRSYSNAS